MNVCSKTHIPHWPSRILQAEYSPFSILLPSTFHDSWDYIRSQWGALCPPPSFSLTHTLFFDIFLHSSKYNQPLCLSGLFIALLIGTRPSSLLIQCAAYQFKQMYNNIDVLRITLPFSLFVTTSPGVGFLLLFTCEKPFVESSIHHRVILRNLL